MAATYLLGIDLGTSGVKVLLLPEDGEATGTVEATVEYPLHTPRSGWSEQDPADWWAGTAAAIQAVLQQSAVPPERIVGLALSGQMHGATLLDASGDVLRPCILWNDQRSAAECDLITERVGLPNLVGWVGNPALAGFTAPKLLWVRGHEPEVYRRITSVLLPKDYINFRLTGVRATEASDASGTLLFDVRNRTWSDEMLAELGIPAHILPPVHSSTEIIGAVTVEASALTGLQAGTPVIAGGADNACAAIGLGVVRPGQVLTSLGTSGVIVAPVAEPALDPLARLHLFCHVVPDTWYLMGVVLSAGASLRWFRDTIGGGPGEGYDQIVAAAETIPPGSDGLLFLPYLSGERTPHGDPDARGAYVGLSLHHTHAHLARAVIEGVTFALADSAHVMRDLGVPIDVIRATGGGARSPFWRQMQADVLGARVVTARSATGPALGAAILAGVGSGVFPSVAEATDRLVEVGDALSPNEANAAVYRRSYDVYRAMYPALHAQFKALAALWKDA